MSGWVLSLLPIIMFALMLIINPDYVSLLIKTEQGQKMLMASGAMMIIGILIIRKIVNIKV
jgi:tight adherence protein B